MKPYIKSKNI